MNITPIQRPTPQPFLKYAVTPDALTASNLAALKPMGPKVPANSVTPRDFGFKYSAPCGILTIYTLDNGERVALAEMQEWIVVHIRKTKCAQCDVVYYGDGDAPELQDFLPL